jgi:hypothetical protein
LEFFAVFLNFYLFTSRFLAEHTTKNKSLYGGKLGRPKVKWENDIKIDLKQITCDSTYCIQLAQVMVLWWTFVIEKMVLVVFIRREEFCGLRLENLIHGVNQF